MSTSTPADVHLNTVASSIHTAWSKRLRRGITRPPHTADRNVINPTNSAGRHVANANNFCR